MTVGERGEERRREGRTKREKMVEEAIEMVDRWDRNGRCGCHLPRSSRGLLSRWRLVIMRSLCSNTHR